jgi:Na+-translocating ferredoxin:NAD+ oxidoreductase RNF subunit RnfB
MDLITGIATLGGLSLLLATLLVGASRKLHVPEDPRIDLVEEMLPHANCGACGEPGCRLFAEALVAGTARPGLCSVSSPEGHARIARFLEVDVGAVEKRVARLACAGGANVARRRAHYEGHASCGAAAIVAGGGKSCFWGCLGLGDCAEACDFDALHLDAHDLPIVSEEKCTACGDCVDACPKDLFSIHPVSHRLWVACRSQEAGDRVLDECEVGCTACGRCAMDAPGVVTMVNELPVVDYGRSISSRAPIERCPTGAIVWIDPVEGFVKGAEAHEVIRKGRLRDAAT